MDALRGLAALWVVFFHARAGSHVDALCAALPGWLGELVFSWGHLGVPVFFVLSGFVMAHSLRAVRVAWSEFGSFLLRRSIRLDPPYWASIALVIGYGSAAAWANQEAISLPSWRSLLAHALYLQEFLGIERLSMIYWTLCQEVQFYLVFWLMVACIRAFAGDSPQSRLWVFGVAAIGSLMWPLGLLTENPIPGSFLPFWHAFLLGVFAYWSWQEKLPRPAFWTMAIVVLVAGLVSGRSFSTASACGAVLLYVAGIRNGMWEWLKGPVAQHLGRISYSLYLTHTVVLGATFFVLPKVAGKLGFAAMSYEAEAAMLVIAIGASILFATVFWWSIERPAVGLSRWIGGRRRQDDPNIASRESAPAVAPSGLKP